MSVRDLLIHADQLIQAGQCDDAAALLGNALMEAGPSEKRRIIVLLERTIATSTAGACNLGLALLRGDGVPADPQRGATLLESVVDSGDPTHAAFAHNFLGHFHRGGFGPLAEIPRAVSHFEQAGQLGNAEAAQRWPPPRQGRARHHTRRGAGGGELPARRGARIGARDDQSRLVAGLGEVPDGDTDQAADLLQASDLGDGHAADILQLLKDDDQQSIKRRASRSRVGRRKRVQ